MTDAVPEITADVVSERLSQLVIEEGAATSADLAYREAAAVRASFDPNELRPVGAPPDAKALARLLQMCDPVYAASGRLEWRLPDAIRRETLAAFYGDEGLQEAAANATGGGPVQRMLSAYTTRTAPPLETQSYEDLLATAQVTSWLHGIAPGTPDPDEVKDRLAIAEMLAPMRQLVGSSFRGRVDVLKRLHDYADILPPEGRLKAIRRQLRRFHNLRDNPPLVLHGPGGVGKSTVLAKFVLDHAEGAQRIPFVYIDFDRPGMLPHEPLTLLVDALRQLGVEHQAVRARAEALRARWLERLSQPDISLLTSAVIDPPAQLPDGSPDVPETLKLRSAVSVREPYYQEFADVVRTISADKPLLFALDTFETVQQYGVDVVHEVWEFLDGLLRRLPSLRVVIAGRAPLDGYRTRPVHLAGFDEESARAFLSSLLGSELAADTELVGHIVATVGRNPLSLRLAADLVINHGATELDEISGRRVLSVRVKTEQVQGWLYRRVLDRIADPDVRALAHPGLVVRRLTPGVIRHVLAGPCHVEVPDDARAMELFDACAREVSLLSRDTDGSLQHRADVRREMLPLLQRAEPDRVTDIHSAAIAYYQTYSDVVSRAEELYHRLCLHDSIESLDQRWQHGVENYLGMSLEELPAEGQVYLGSRLGITLPPDVVSQAKLYEQERYTVTRVRQLIRLGELGMALDVIGQQVNRTSDGSLDVLEAQALEELGRLDKASEVLDRASQRAADAADSKILLELQYAAARLAERQGQAQRALELLAATRAAMPEPPDLLMLLRLWSTELRVRRAASGKSQAEAAQPEISTARAELIRLVDAAPQEQIAQDLTLLVELASEIGEARPAVVIQALLLFGLPELSSSQAGKLGTALAQWDASNNHRLASGLHLPTRPGSQAGAWDEWLRDTPTKSATQNLAAILDRYPHGEPVIAALSSIYRESLAASRPSVPM